MSPLVSTCVHIPGLPAGGHPVCGGAGTGPSAAPVRAGGSGVYSGTQSDYAGTHGPAHLPAAATGTLAKAAVY